MMERLLLLKAFCDRHSNQHPELSLTEDEWAEIVDLAEALKPAKITTKTLQFEQLTMGDFYGAWIKCKLQTQKIGTTFAKKIVAAMNSRERILTSNDAFISAIFLDRR